MKRTSLERKSDREIVITRTFRAPARIVFDAWTRPEHVKRWWAPASRGVSLVRCDVDLRPGGTYCYVLALGEAQRFGFFGKYLEIERPTRIVYTQGFDPSGGPAPAAILEGAARSEHAVVTVKFEEREGSTRLTAHELYPSKEALDGALSTGMEDGMGESFDQLDALLESLRG
jgi:uncharacterized protein YndB with AHSA1/START domain